MVWREPKNHSDDCYFCTVNMKGFNRIKNSTWFYPDLESARRPVLHCDEIPVPKFTHLPDLKMNESMMNCPESETTSSDSSASEYEGASYTQEQFNQMELNDLVRYLALSKELSEVLASRLNEKKMPWTRYQNYVLSLQVTKTTSIFHQRE